MSAQVDLIAILLIGPLMDLYSVPGSLMIVALVGLTSGLCFLLTFRRVPNLD